MKEIPFPLKVRDVPKDYQIDMKTYPLIRTWDDICDLLKFDEKERNDVAVEIDYYSSVWDFNILVGMPELVWFYKEADVFQQIIDDWDTNIFKFDIRKPMPLGGKIFVRIEHLLKRNVK